MFSTTLFWWTNVWIQKQILTQHNFPLSKIQRQKQNSLKWHLKRTLSLLYLCWCRFSSTYKAIFRNHRFIKFSSAHYANKCVHKSEYTFPLGNWIPYIIFEAGVDLISTIQFMVTFYPMVFRQLSFFSLIYVLNLIIPIFVMLNMF